MADESDIHANWRVNVLVHCVFELGFLYGTKQCLGHSLTFAKLLFFLSLCLLCDKSFIFA